MLQTQRYTPVRQDSINVIIRQGYNPMISEQQKAGAGKISQDATFEAGDPISSFYHGCGKGQERRTKTPTSRIKRKTAYFPKKTMRNKCQAITRKTPMVTNMVMMGSWTWELNCPVHSERSINSYAAEERRTAGRAVFRTVETRRTFGCASIVSVRSSDETLRLRCFFSGTKYCSHWCGES
jgi:hypothetical protein